MDLQYSKTQQMIARSMRKFSTEVLGEFSFRMDRESQPLSPEIIREMGAVNIWGIQAPVEYGGAALDSISYSIVIEEISRVSAAAGLAVTVHNSVCLAPLLKFGSERQKKRYASDLSEGKKIGGFSLTEPGAGSDASAIQTTAMKHADGYILNGRKAFVTNGGNGDVFLVAAVVDRAKKNRGIGIFIVEKGMEGFSVGKIEDMMGMRGNPVSELCFDNVTVPHENVLGSVADGFSIAMQALDTGRIGIASQALGIGMAAFESAASYAAGRRQFGKPIGAFQGVSFKLAEMKTRLDATRLLIYKAAHLKDLGMPFSTESAECKLYASDTAMWACREALQVFGGYGYVKDLPVERYFRDAKITEIYEGTSEVMKIIIGNAVLKEFSKI